MMPIVHSDSGGVSPGEVRSNNDQYGMLMAGRTLKGFAFYSVCLRSGLEFQAASYYIGN